MVGLCVLLYILLIYPKGMPVETFEYRRRIWCVDCFPDRYQLILFVGHICTMRTVRTPWYWVDQFPFKMIIPLPNCHRTSMVSLRRLYLKPHPLYLSQRQ